ncbi:MAG: family 16 glycosylhydrolase [Clostridia bacterium]|nr:family 16 glycosylhydrolase [Clostridia bacterium]
MKRIFENIKNKFSHGFGPAWAGSKLLFLPIIALAVIVALLVVLMIVGKKTPYQFDSRSYSEHRYNPGWSEFSQDDVSESSSDSGSDQSETDEQYYERMSKLLRDSVACNVEREGYTETAAKSIKTGSFYKIVYGADDNAIRVAPDITDARTTRTSDGFNTVVTPDVTIYHEPRRDSNSQEFLLTPAAEGGYYIISKSSGKMLAEVGGYPMLRDAGFVSGRRWDVKKAESGRYVITSLSDGGVLNMYHGQLVLEKAELMDDDAWFIYEVDPSASWQSVFVDNFEPGYISAMWTRKGNDLTTDGSWVFDGGRIEIKARLKQGARAYMTALTATGEAARVDIFDASTFDETLRCGVSFTDGATTVKHGQLGVGAGLTDWHEYAVEWDSEQVRFYFDGVMYSVFNVTTDAARASFSGTLMTLSIEGFAPPYSENIDYVKFRKRRGETLSVAGGGTPLDPTATASAGGACHGAAAVNGGYAIAVADGVEFYSESGNRYRVVSGFDGTATSLIPARGGDLLLVLCRGGKNAYVIDCVTGAYKTLSGHTDSITCGALAVSGVCVTGARDGTIRIWGAESGNMIAVINAESVPRSADINSVGDRFAVGFNDGYVRVYNTQSHKLFTYFNGHDCAVTALDFINDGKLASGDASGKLMLWDLYVNIRYYTSSHCLSAINGIYYYGGALYTSGGDGAIRRYALSEPVEITAVRALHGAAVCEADVRGAVLSVGYDGRAFLCDAELNVRYELKGMTGFAAGCAVSNDGKHAVVCAENGRLCFYSL